MREPLGVRNPKACALKAKSDLSGEEWSFMGVAPELRIDLASCGASRAYTLWPKRCGHSQWCLPSNKRKPATCKTIPLETGDFRIKVKLILKISCQFSRYIWWSKIDKIVKINLTLFIYLSFTTLILGRCFFLRSLPMIHTCH